MMSSQKDGAVEWRGALVVRFDLMSSQKSDAVEWLGTINDEEVYDNVVFIVKTTLS